jgi:NAD(P)-dependent dehydrogenase (short-subunit alcohol dehydrogenase family)
VRGNYLSQLALVQAVLPAMVEQGGGTIVNMASGSATNDPPAPPDKGGWSLAYAASKAACGRIAGAVNAEYLSRGIRCFNVDPGFVVTEAMQARGGASAIGDQGYPSAPPDAAGTVIAWLARDPAATKYLGKVIWAPTLVERIA